MPKNKWTRRRFLETGSGTAALVTLIQPAAAAVFTPDERAALESPGTVGQRDFLLVANRRRNRKHGSARAHAHLFKIARDRGFELSPSPFEHTHELTDGSVGDRQGRTIVSDRQCHGRRSRAFRPRRRRRSGRSSKKS